MLPTFLVIGASKCGTTSVCDILSEHPGVFVTDPKEPHYFVFEEFEEWRQWYEELFDGVQGHKAAGEGSVSYTLPNKAEIAASRIKQLIPDCRLIYMVRHPLRRLESDWKMRTIEGRNPGSLKTAVRDYPDLVTIGAYWTQLSAYRRYFPDDQILVCFLEDFAGNPTQEIARILTHIGADPDLVPTSVKDPRNAAQARQLAVSLRSLGPIYSVARRLKRLLPKAVSNFVIGALARRQPDLQVDWDVDTHKYVVAKLEADARQMLLHCGKPTGFWDLGLSPRR